MELRLSFASMNDIIDQLDKLKTQATNREEPEIVMPLENADLEDSIRVTFVSEDDDEFEPPSAALTRD